MAEVNGVALFSAVASDESAVVVGIQRERTAVVPLGGYPIPFSLEHRLRECSVRLCQLGVELDCAQRGRLGLRTGHRRR